MILFLAALTGVGGLLVVAVRKKTEWLLNVVMRSILGVIGIYFINLMLASCGFSVNVGVNEVTLLTCGILGFPGLAALYGLGFFRLL